VNPAFAQVDQKASVVNLQGQVVEVPYVSFDVFQAVHLQRGEDTVPLHKLLMVSSADEVTAQFGTPDSTHTITGEGGLFRLICTTRERRFDSTRRTAAHAGYHL